MKKGAIVEIKKVPFPKGYAPRQYTVQKIDGKYAFIRGLGWGLKKNLKVVKP